MFLFYSHTAAAAHLIDHLPEYISGLKTISLQNFESSFSIDFGIKDFYWEVQYHSDSIFDFWSMGLWKFPGITLDIGLFSFIVLGTQ